MKDAKGFTLTETLFCILILSILAMLVLTGFKTAHRSLDSMAQKYRANALAEDLLSVITEEIRYSQDLTIEASENGSLDVRLCYNSDMYGENTILTIDEAEPDSSYGILTIISEEKNGGSDPIRPCYFLYDELWICPLDDETTVFEEDGDCIVVSFGICNEAGEIVSTVENVYIRMLNSDETTSFYYNKNRIDL